MARHTIHISDAAFELLLLLKHKGQSSDGFITETLERLAKQNHRGEIIKGGNNDKPTKINRS
jgi:predicted CopG family antitoxin